MPTETYRELVTDMNAGIGWRDLGVDLERAPERNVAITGIDHVVVDGNFPWNLIRVRTDAGVAGVGEAFTGPVAEQLAYLAPALLGENPYDLDRLAEHMTQLVSGLGGTQGYAQAAVAGIDAALYDIVGKLEEVPVYQLLGGKYRDRILLYADCHAGAALEHADRGGEATEASATEPDAEAAAGTTSTTGGDGETYVPAAYAATARETAAEGFDTLKFDLDTPAGGADTAHRRLGPAAIDHAGTVAAAVAEAVPDVEVAYDLHWNFGVETAHRVAQAVEPAGPAWLEDPVPPERPDTHRTVREGTTVPILTGENLVRLEGALPFLEAGAIDILAPDIQKCGGLSEFRSMAAVAEAYGVPIAPHNVASPVGTMASVHACASVPGAFVLEYHAREVDWWADLVERVDGRPLIVDGAVPVPETPGLGVDVDADVLRANAAPGWTGWEPVADAPSGTGG